jgi:hypothetical protein
MNRETIDLLQQQVGNELDPYMKEGDYKSAAQYCLAKIYELSNIRGEADDSAGFVRYLYIIHLLQIQIEFPHLKEQEVTQLFKLAEASLHLSGVRENSPLSYLFDELHICRSQIIKQENRPLGAQWSLALGKRFLKNDQLWLPSAIHETSSALYFGYVFQAAHGFEKLAAVAGSVGEDELQIFLELQAIKACRLSHDLKKAEVMLSHLSADPRLSPETRALIDWEGMWLALLKSGEITEFERIISGKKKEYFCEPYLSLIYLLFHAHSASARLIKLLPVIATIRKRYPRQLSSTDKILLNVFELLQALHDADLSLVDRLGRVTPLLDDISALHAEYQLLIFAALVRWASRQKQKSFVAIALGQYRELSCRMSNYQNNDVLGMMQASRHSRQNRNQKHWPAAETLVSHEQDRLESGTHAHLQPLCDRTDHLLAHRRCGL